MFIVIESLEPTRFYRGVKWGKIDKSWKTAKVESITKKTFSKGPEWVLTLDNAGKKRYVFITLDGFVAGSNDTGN